jgi:hypothetical protein
MTSSVSRELGSLAKTVADTESRSTMPAQVLPTVGEQRKIPQPKKEPTRMEAIRAAKARITRRSSLQKQQEALKGQDPTTFDNWNAWFLESISRSCEGTTVRAPSIGVRLFRPRRTISSDAWKAVRGLLSSRSGLLERRICSARDRRVECPLDCLRMVRASEYVRPIAPYRSGKKNIL